eukprot:5645794-Alexandrium_andersonii.AAC.1
MPCLAQLCYSVVLSNRSVNGHALRHSCHSNEGCPRLFRRICVSYQCSSSIRAIAIAMAYPSGRAIKL